MNTWVFVVGCGVVNIFENVVQYDSNMCFYGVCS